MPENVFGGHSHTNNEIPFLYLFSHPALSRRRTWTEQTRC